MTPKELRTAMYLAEVRAIDVARFLGVSAQAVHRVISHKGTSRRIEDALAAALNRPAESLFPWRTQPSDVANAT